MPVTGTGMGSLTHKEQKVDKETEKELMECFKVIAAEIAKLHGAVESVHTENLKLQTQVKALWDKLEACINNK